MTGLEYVNGVLSKYAVDSKKAVQYRTLLLPSKKDNLALGATCLRMGRS